MWAVIKFDKKKIHIFKEDLKKKFGDNFQIYYPKLSIQNYQKNKLKERNINLLEDYLFCFHSKFSNEKNISQLKFLRGVKYFLNGYKESQIEINNFIHNLKKLENENGYITQSIYQTEINKIYKFTSGPFTQKIFKIINLNKDKIDILIGNIKTRINKKKFLFKPV
mgnify:FL=1|tara:strand:- start:47 stop:544 length:498 start_codon:yes stop_codon:yes gene_type:complete